MNESLDWFDRAAGKRDERLDYFLASPGVHSRGAALSPYDRIDPLPPAAKETRLGISDVSCFLLKEDAC
jgi:hypothetical protein